jgi:hypothetical protein
MKYIGDSLQGGNTAVHQAYRAARKSFKAVRQAYKAARSMHPKKPRVANKAARSQAYKEARQVYKAAHQTYKAARSMQSLESVAEALGNMTIHAGNKQVEQ